MDQQFLQRLHADTEALREAGLYKAERIITSPQKADIAVGDGDVLNFCANNYLGLANHPALRDAAKEGIDRYGFGMASVRFICGTQDIHKALESAVSKFLQTDDTILYTSCFDANGGLFETLLGKEDAILSDALNHASIIDGVRLSKAMRYRYETDNMEDLERQLKKAEADGAAIKLIATDGVFSMDGTIANLAAICDLAEKYNALVMVDDSHATGFLGKTGRGSIEYCDVMGRVDIITSTLGKALGGASGGFTSGRKEIIEILRQRSRPYLFSNTVAPAIVGAALKAFELLSETTELRDQLEENTLYFREAMAAAEAGFDLLKFFPAEQAGGLDYLKSLQGPLPDIRFCPTGSITREQAPDYLALGNVVCVGGSWIASKTMVEQGDWAGIEANARAAAAMRT